jgi:hypothetical protein
MTTKGAVVLIDVEGNGALHAARALGQLRGASRHLGEGRQTQISKFLHDNRYAKPCRVCRQTTRSLGVQEIDQLSLKIHQKFLPDLFRHIRRHAPRRDFAVRGAVSNIVPLEQPMASIAATFRYPDTLQMRMSR